jgi:hypothetical protein
MLPSLFVPASYFLERNLTADLFLEGRGESFFFCFFFLEGTCNPPISACQLEWSLWTRNNEVPLPPPSSEINFVACVRKPVWAATATAVCKAAVDPPTHPLRPSVIGHDFHLSFNYAPIAANAFDRGKIVHSSVL